MLKKLLLASIPVAIGAAIGGSGALAVNAAFLTNPVTPLVYPYTPLTPGQHNLAPVSSTGLTIPVGAAYATVCASTATVKYTTDGTTTPTSSVGQPLTAGTCVALNGAIVLANFRAISASGTLDIEYFQ